MFIQVSSNRSSRYPSNESNELLPVHLQKTEKNWKDVNWKSYDSSY